jgi:WD40 repeat protein
MRRNVDLAPSKRHRDDVPQRSFLRPGTSFSSRATSCAPSSSCEVGDTDAPPARLSRHIPHRDEMNMAVASYNLTSKPPSFSQTDQSSYLSENGDESGSFLYNERLAQTLGGQGSGKLGGEVLKFGTSATSSGALKDITSNRLDPSRLENHHRGVGAHCRQIHQRVLNTNPIRVLDAPQLRSYPATQLLHWGSNDKVIVGLTSSVFMWDASTDQSARVVDMPSHLAVRCVQWVHRCLGVAIAATDGTIGILDIQTGAYLRSLRPLEGTVSQLAVEGSTLAAASNTNGSIYVFDVRAQNSLVAQHEGHRGRVCCIKYCASEPHYLASGAVDGAVKVWDARRPSCPRYSFSRVHSGSVLALEWNPDKRTTLFSGGDDGVLNFLDTHVTSLAADDPAHGAHVIRSVKTGQPLSGIICPPRSAEVATSHTGVGQIQLRKVSTFQSVGTFVAHNANDGLCCMTIAPDMERICAAQEDETLKFWSVFDASESDGSALQHNPRGVVSQRTPTGGVSNTSSALLDDVLR